MSNPGMEACCICFFFILLIWTVFSPYFIGPTSSIGQKILQFDPELVIQPTMEEIEKLRATNNLIRGKQDELSSYKQENTEPFELNEELQARFNILNSENYELLKKEGAFKNKEAFLSGLELRNTHKQLQNRTQELTTLLEELRIESSELEERIEGLEALREELLRKNERLRAEEINLTPEELVAAELSKSLELEEKSLKEKYKALQNIKDSKEFLFKALVASVFIACTIARYSYRKAKQAHKFYKEIAKINLGEVPITCDSCKHQYSKIEREPWLLPCGHSICGSCVYIKQKDCIICGRNYDPRLLPKNFALKELIAKF